MSRDSVTVRVDVDAPVTVVWSFLTTQRAAWWPELRFDAAVGSPLVETWTEDGRPAYATGTITQCLAPSRLAFEWTQRGWAGPLDIVIDLVTQGQSTSVTLSESGFARAHTPPSLESEHEEGWRYHLRRLKRVSEGDAVDVQSS